MTAAITTRTSLLHRMRRRPGAGLLVPGAALVCLPWALADYQRIFAAEILIRGLFALSFAIRRRRRHALLDPAGP